MSSFMEEWCDVFLWNIGNNLAALFSHLLVLVLGSILLELITNRMLSEEAYFVMH
jgi:hypothetical protein